MSGVFLLARVRYDFCLAAIAASISLLNSSTLLGVIFFPSKKKVGVDVSLLALKEPVAAL